MRSGHSRQRDLFEGEREWTEFPAPLRHELIHLIERLLAEAVSRVEVQSEGHETKEPAHEQDHA